MQDTLVTSVNKNEEKEKVSFFPVKSKHFNQLEI